MKRKILGLALASFCLTSLSATHADTISFDAPFGPSPVASPTTSISLPKFDPALGTLTMVELILDAETSAGSIGFDNEAGVGSDVTLGIGAEVTATAPSALTAVAVPLQTDDGTVDPDNDGAADFIGSDAFEVVGGSGTDNDSDSSTAAPVLAAYTATFLGELFDTDIDSVAETFLSSTGGFGPIDPTPGVFEGTVEVIYTFTPIPEPSTLVLAGCGLLAMGWFGIRRKR